MKRKIAFVLLITLVLTSATFAFAAGKGNRARLNTEACSQNEECVYDGEGPQDGTGFQHKSDGGRRLGAEGERSKECLQNGECLYDGEGPQDGSGQQFRSGAGMQNKAADRSECLCGSNCIGRKTNQ